VNDQVQHEQKTNLRELAEEGNESLRLLCICIERGEATVSTTSDYSYAALSALINESD
jgi:hypothetical protein